MDTDNNSTPENERNNIDGITPPPTEDLSRDLQYPELTIEEQEPDTQAQTPTPQPEEEPLDTTQPFAQEPFNQESATPTPTNITIENTPASVTTTVTTSPANNVTKPAQPASAPAPTPVSAGDPTVIVSSNPQPPKQSRKGLIATIIILVVLLLAGAGVAAYFLFFQPKPADPASDAPAAATTQDTQPTPVAEDAAKTIIEKVRASQNALASTYSTLEISEQTVSPIYKAKDVDYYVYSKEFGYSVDAMLKAGTATDTESAAFIAASRSATAAVLAGEGLTKSTPSSYYAIYQNSNVTCSLTVEGDLSVAACANIADYTKTLSDIAPFAPLILAKNTDAKESAKANTLLLSNPTINQKQGGYRNATINVASITGIGGYAGIFYGKDDTWTYWRGTQQQLPCADHNTYALQKSFEGDTCIKSDGSEGTVTVTLKE